VTSDPPKMVWLGRDAAEETVTAELVGAKAAGIWRMARLGLRTPAAFALPTTLCAAANARPKAAASLVADGLREGMARLEAETRRRFGDVRAPLVVSVRSGAARSMPGMLSTVLNVGLGPEAVHGLIRLSGNPRFAWDSYRRFIESYATVVGQAPANAFAGALADMVRAESAADESELDGEALERLCAIFGDIAAAQATRPIPLDPMDQLSEAARAVFRSWESRKAREYRRLNGLEGLSGTAVTVQAMVFGNDGRRSGSGVAFTRNPATGEKAPYVDFLFDAQGEDVVSGRRTPLEAAAVAAGLPEAFAELVQGAGQLERALGDVQDIEFTIEDGVLFFLQMRAAKRAPKAALRIAVDLVHEGVIDRKTALARLAEVDIAQAASSRFAEPAEPVASGIAAAPGMASGRAAFDNASAKQLAAEGAPVVLVRREPATEDIEGFAVAKAILTACGGRTAHAAVVARQMGKVCIVGCQGLDLEAAPARLGARPLHQGDWISLDGDTGEVTLGRRTIVTEPPSELAEISAWRSETVA